MPQSDDRSTLRRAGALLQAALFFLSLSIAPAVHGKLCDDVCALENASTHDGGSCHAHGSRAHETGPKADCQCLGDCCSITACCVTPDSPCDAAPPSALSTRAAWADPEATPRAPEAWLLPYPTGPPPAA